jgi:antitoxin component of RelBE/YafQ-DinJ toxin-antitoxin module
MGKSSTIRARIEPDLKGKAGHIFQQLELTTTQAITFWLLIYVVESNRVVFERTGTHSDYFQE